MVCCEPIRNTSLNLPADCARKVHQAIPHHLFQVQWCIGIPWHRHQAFMFSIGDQSCWIHCQLPIATIANWLLSIANCLLPIDTFLEPWRSLKIRWPGTQRWLCSPGQIPVLLRRSPGLHHLHLCTHKAVRCGGAIPSPIFTAPMKSYHFFSSYQSIHLL